MKAALIAPLSELESVDHADKIHLLLAHLVAKPEYWQFYLKRKIAGDYIILDNSAHEFRKPVPPKRLILDAIFVRADEVVVPDVPYDSEGTLKVARACLDAWAKDHDFKDLRPRLMLVPQGDTLQDWRSCLFALVLKAERIAREYPGVFRLDPPVIGLPAKYHARPGFSVPDMLEKWLMPLAAKGYPIHLLGCRDLWGLNELANSFTIRSIDSAKPFVYARKGIVLDPMNERPPESITRPENYFEMSFSEHQRKVAGINASVFRKLAQGRYTGHK